MIQRSLPELLRTASPRSSPPPSAAVAGLFLDDNPVVRRHQQLLSVVVMDRSPPPSNNNDQDDKEDSSPSYSMPQRPLLTSDMRKGRRSSVDITTTKPTHTIEQEIVALHRRRMMRIHHQQQQQQLGDPDDAPPAVHESPLSPSPPTAVDKEERSGRRLPSSCLGANPSPSSLLSGCPPPHHQHTEDRRHVARRSPSNRHPSRGWRGWGVFLLVLAALVLIRLQQWK